jgi:hypothetical protein
MQQQVSSKLERYFGNTSMAIYPRLKEFYFATDLRRVVNELIIDDNSEYFTAMTLHANFVTSSSILKSVKVTMYCGTRGVRNLFPVLCANISRVFENKHQLFFLGTTATPHTCFGNC